MHFLDNNNNNLFDTPYSTFGKKEKSTRTGRFVRISRIGTNRSEIAEANLIKWLGLG